MKTFDVGIVGLGYVGLTLATVLAECGFKVFGVEKRQDVVDSTNLGIPHFSEVGLSEALKRVTGKKLLQAKEQFDKTVNCKTYIITVGTPLDQNGHARSDMIVRASEEVANNMDDGALVILRSTVKIGTARNVVKPILHRTGKKYYLAMCPERTLEGKALEELRHLPQIIGSDTVEGYTLAANFFRSLTNTIVHLGSLEAAEIVKLVDNTFRDVQFGFANEIAQLCETFGVSAIDVITAGKLGYPRTNVAWPGPVGGPCLEKDPHILTEAAHDKGLEMPITSAARAVNESQPFNTARFIINEMKNRNTLHGGRVVILGMAFKGIPETDDLRGSMSIKIISSLLEFNNTLNISLYDPVILKEDLQARFNNLCVYDNVTEALTDKDVAVIANNHPKLGTIMPMNMKLYLSENAFIYDYWNHFSKLSKRELGNDYFALGNMGINHV